MKAECTYHSSEDSIEFCDVCCINLCTLCAYSHKATFPCHIPVTKKAAAKQAMDDICAKVGYCVPIECELLIEMFEEKKLNIIESVKNTEVTAKKILENIESDLIILRKSCAEWVKIREKATRLCRELACKYVAEDYNSFFAYLSNESWIYTASPPNKIPSFLGLTILEKCLAKTLVEIKRQLPAYSVSNIAGSEPPIIHLIEESPILTLHCYNICEAKSRSFRIPSKSVGWHYDSALLRGAVYIVGGYEGMKAKSEVFSYKMGKENELIVARKADMICPRFNHTLVTIPGELLYAIGGSSIGPRDNKLDLSSCEVYYPDSDQWHDVPSLNEARSGIIVCLFESRYIYTFGGLSMAKAKDLETIEVFDRCAETAGWVIIRPLNAWTGRHSGGAVQISATSILIFGGYNEKSLDSVIEFNPIINNFVERDPMPQVSSFQQRKAVMSGDSMYTADYFYKFLFKFTPRTKEWSIIHRKNWIHNS